jgi:hypothetical protein
VYCGGCGYLNIRSLIFIRRKKYTCTIFLLRVELNKCEDVWLNLKLYSLCLGEVFKSTKCIIKICGGNQELIV